MIDTGLAVPGDVTIDYERGIAFVNRLRVAKWSTNGETNMVMIDESKLKDAKIDVEAEKIIDAMNELLQE